MQIALFNAQDENRRLPGEFPYVRCPGCGWISCAEPPTDLGRYYPEIYYDIPSYSEITRRATAETNKIATIKKFKNGGRLLEVGPAFGAFALRAQTEGFSVTCIERDRRCCDFLTSTLSLNTICADDPIAALRQLPRFDVIALWHVIEHLPAPLEFLSAAAENLVPGGILAIGTPNPLAWQFQVMGCHWPHVDAPRHLHLMPASALVDYGRGQGLEECHLDSDDSDARSWNRFGWQRLFMNRIPGKAGVFIGWPIGVAIGMVTRPSEARKMRGSAYTLLLRKGAR